MIIIDVSGAFIRHCHGVLSNPAELTLNNVRHYILNDIRTWRKKYFKEYGEIVLAYDNTASTNYWRRDLFPEYKANRAKARKKSTFNWPLFFEYFDIVKTELADYFPYRVLSIPMCEADELIWFALDERSDIDPERSLIISADKDLKQCQRLPNVRQWSYMTKKFLDEKKPFEYLIEHTIRGDVGDGVPNIYSPDDVFINDSIKQKSIMTKDIERWVKMKPVDIRAELVEILLEKPGKFHKKYTKKEARELIAKNWARNTLVVDLAQTPDKYKTLFSELPDNSLKNLDSVLYQYFINKKMPLMVPCINDFIGDASKPGKKLSFKELQAIKRSRGKL